MNDSSSSFENVPSETSKFGFKIDDEVLIKKEGVFFGQIQQVVGFTKNCVIVSVSGPRGEPDSSWWFEPKDIKKRTQNGQLLN